MIQTYSQNLKRVCAINFVMSSHMSQPSIFHYPDIQCVGTKRSSVSYAMLMRPNKAATAVHGCWFLSSVFILFGSNRVLSLLPVLPWCTFMWHKHTLPTLSHCCFKQYPTTQPFLNTYSLIETLCIVLQQ